MSKDPFDILGVSKVFGIDLQDLNKKYFELQRQYHPDCSPSQESSQSINSSDINWAYSILKNPLMRARTLLDMAGEMLPFDNHQLLMQSLEDRETLETLEAPEDLENFEAQKKKTFHQGIGDLEKSFCQNDLDHAKSLLLELIYLEKLLLEIQKKKDTF